MEIPSIGGLPAHPLIVHMPVVLVPLAAIGAVLMAIRPSWRRALAIPTAVIATVAAIATQLAIGSGEALEHSVRKSDLIETHSQIAEQARPFVFLFALVLIAVAALDWYSRRQESSSAPKAQDDTAAGDVQVVTRQRQTARPRTATAAIVLSVLSVLLGIGATVQVYRTGHSGAKATWNETTEQRDSTGWLRPSGGEGGEGGGTASTVPERGESGESGESGGG